MEKTIASVFEENAFITGHKTYEPTGSVIVGFMLRIPKDSPDLALLESAGLLDICETITQEQLGEIN